MEAAVKRKIPKEYLGAFKEGHRKTARSFVDQDYTLDLLFKAERGDQASKEALEWITKFNNEHYKCVFKKDGTDFTETHEDRKRLQREDWKRREDVTATGVFNIDAADLAQHPSEDLLILLIDLKKEKEKAKKQ